MTGEEVRVVHSETLSLLREAALDDFKAGRSRWLVNCDVLTTGFDSPNIDLIAVMRATESPGLFAQMAGRGFRLHPEKTRCLLLDFGGNLRRHGALDSDDYGKKKPKAGSGDGEAPMKACPACGEEVPAGLRECECGWLFPKPEINHDPTSDRESPVLESQAQQPKRWFVEEVNAWVHTKKGASEGDPQSLCVEYLCQPADEAEPGGNLRGERIREWICVEHEGFARTKAYAWWQQRSTLEFPSSADEALEVFRRGGIADTTEITTIREGRFWRITEHVTGERPDALLELYDDEEIPF